MALNQPELFGRPFVTRTPSVPIYCHQDFLEKLQAERNQPAGKRAAMLMQNLAIDPRRQHYKSTQGENRGWRRSRLGGGGGSHFYAWWAPKAAPPIKAGEGFEAAPDGAVFLRDIRHHDDHAPAKAQSLADYYLPVSVKEMREGEYGPEPWTPGQLRFAASRNPVRILKGHPGSGKTTALLHAADACGAERVLYVTYSKELAGLAREYFDKYCSRDRTFHVITYRSLIRELLEEDIPEADEAEVRRRFRGDLVPYARSMGPWTDMAGALYDEMHAHLIGSALPVALGRFAASDRPRSPDQSYEARRGHYLSHAGARSTLDLAKKLERDRSTALAQQYFPELNLAWRAAGKMPARYLEFDAVALDECQDLTPLEAYVLVELAATISRRRKTSVPFFVAGDEAQTVRPTDFEWGWMNDVLHFRLGTPAEFKLSSNLRSPRSIADLVNHVWDLYHEVQKRDRPSGTGYAEIEDDATDQVLYCSASPGEALNRLFEELAGREGLAIVALDETVRAQAPERVRNAILTACEVKGLDFHSVCVVNGGGHLERIYKLENRHESRTADIESIRRRLAIDELRVALSRPSDRLIWLDINPEPMAVRRAISFLNRDPVASHVSPMVPDALLKALDEEQLDVEERIQRCLQDARQLITVRPELAYSRMYQAVALLGQAGTAAAVQDASVRQLVLLTQAEICFALACRRAPLPAELGRPDLFRRAAIAALDAGRRGLAQVITDAGDVMRTAAGVRAPVLCRLAQSYAAHAAEVESWLRVEIEGSLPSWLGELESAVLPGNELVHLTGILSDWYATLQLPDADQRRRKLFDRAAHILMKNHEFRPALQLLQKSPEPRPDLEAECLEGSGDYAAAAAAYRSMGKREEALACYRALPDFEAAAALIREIGAHPAAESYEWLTRMRELVAARPQSFNRVMKPSEKKLLEQMLEEALGVARKKPATKKAAAKRPAVKKPAARKPGASRRDEFS